MRKHFLLMNILLIGVMIQTGCAGVKIMPEVTKIEGKVVIVQKEIKNRRKYSALYTLKDKLLIQIPNTEMLGEILYPRWSPDGKKIAFYADNGRTLEEVRENEGLYLIDEDGTNLMRAQAGRISSFNFYDNLLLFDLYMGSAQLNNYKIMNLETKNVRKMTEEEVEQFQNTSHWIDDYNRVSPDSKKKITYKSASEAVICNEIYVTDIETEKTEKITKRNHFQFSNDYGVWSSDSKKIMYLWTSVLERQAIRIYDLESKKTVNILIRPGGRDITGFDWWTPPVK